jgi:hypothetical protein
MKQDLRHPLNWPFGWKRTSAADRRRSPFSETADVARQRYNPATQKYETVNARATKRIGMRAAVTRLQDQLDRLGATDIVLSTNVELTLMGEPHAGRVNPSDVGVACYFRLLRADRVLACDCWQTVAENIAAIANHIDALRRIDRYGVGTIQQAFAGYDALPPPSADNRPAWRATLGFRPESRVTVDDINLNYRTLAKKDPTNEHRLLDLNLAREAALRELGAM